MLKLNQKLKSTNSSITLANDLKRNVFFCKILLNNIDSSVLLEFTVQVYIQYIVPFCIDGIEIDRITPVMYVFIYI